MNRWLTGLLILALAQLGLSPVFAQQDAWPRTLSLEEGQFTIYMPRVDKLEGDTLYYRAALAYRENADSEPVFGAGWLDSTVNIDRERGLVQPMNLHLREARFPAGTADIKVDLATRLATESGRWNLDFPLDDLESALELAEAEANAAEKLNTQPPEIIYRDHPALLVSMDGEPIIRDIENSDYKAVINTPYPLIYNNRRYYLNAARDVWYSAENATGPYRYEPQPPGDVAAMVDETEPETSDEATAVAITAANAPEIIVSTKPAELIVTDGPAAFVPLVDDLLVLENSETDVFMHYSTQHYYTVLAGRWYHADSLNGDWQYQAAEELPEAFANIPKTSEQADSRVFVAGTEEAREAVLDAEVPQTAAVKRGEADVEVVYDGRPVYASVDGTDMVYIRNTGSTVLKSGGLFYLVENGVWYVSASPDGPWQVSDHRPEQVDTILPTSPVYNSKYVYVYAATPEVVYVGYTPGYTGSYVYQNTIVYGTGYYYPAWISPYYYYPRYSTWGFSVNYNPWSGWNFGLSWGWGPFSVGYYSGGYWHRNHHWHHRHFGYWGPRGYRSRPHHYSRRGGHYVRDNHHRRHQRRDRYTDNGRDSWGRRDGRMDGNRRDYAEHNENLYRDRSQRARVVNSRDRRASATERRYASTRRANNNAAGSAPRRNYDGVKKGERNRIGPISRNDLRKKAKNREANSIESNRDRLLADNRHEKYRALTGDSDRRAGSRNNIRRSDPAAKSRNIRPVSTTRTRETGNRHDNRRTSRKGSQSSGIKGETRQTTQPVTRRSSPAKGIRVTNRSDRRQPVRETSRPRQQPSANARVLNKSPGSPPVRRVEAPRQMKSVKPRAAQKAAVQASPKQAVRPAPKARASSGRADKPSATERKPRSDKRQRSRKDRARPANRRSN